MNEVHPINEEAYEMWRDWRQREKKIKIKPTGEKLQRKFLSKYPPPVQQVIIEKSIMNDYQGLFPLQKAEYEEAIGLTGRDQHTRRLSSAERARLARQGSGDTGRSSSVGCLDTDIKRVANGDNELGGNPSNGLGLCFGEADAGTDSDRDS